jgi:hypothetical protein
MKTKINKKIKKPCSKSKSQKKKYKVRNWREYNDSLVKRGMLDVYVVDSVIDDWFAPPTAKPGARPVYSDATIALVLQFGAVFGQKLRQTEGLVRSILRLMGLDLPVPDFSTLSRRAGNITVNLPKSSKEKIVVVADSTGLKVYGEGEWKVRMHGYSKRRTWRKLHLLITPDGEIREAELTPNSIADCTALPGLLAEETAEIEKFIGDGGYDKTVVYEACRKKQVKEIVIPPQKNARIKKHGNAAGEPHPRDENLRRIRQTSRKRWKEMAGYHVRSLAETAMYRFKTIFGDRLNARDENRQRTEVMIKLSILNKMTFLGMPGSYAIG